MAAVSRVRSKAAVVLSAVLLFGAGGGTRAALAQTSVRSGDAAIARAYFDEARQRAAAGDWSGAAPLLAAAEEIDSGDSDLRYLAALASIQNGGSIAQGLDELDAALAADRFTYYRRDDAVSLRSELLIRSGRYAEALAALRGLPLDADTLWMRCRAFEGRGDTSSFDAELRTALRLYPDDPRFPRVFLESLGDPSRSAPRSAEAAALGDTILARLRSYAALDPELPVLAAPIMQDRKARRDAVLAYRSAGGRSARATLLALDYGLVDQKTACDELFSGRYPLKLADIEAALALARSGADRDLVAAAFDAYSGPIVLKKDGGIAETAELKSGRPVSWSRSYDDERGHISYELELADEEPARLVVSIPGTEIRVGYSSYPYCSTIAFSEGGATTDYRFDPDQYFFAPVKLRSVLGSGSGERFVPVYSDAPLPTERACAAAALEIGVSSGDSRQITTLDRGIPLKRVTWKSGRLYAILSYERGLPRIERVDADGDGRFETERVYATGEDGVSKVEWILIDTKGTGIFDYREQTVFPFRKEWDFDRNGSIDAVQYQQKDGSIVREFSTGLDGRFDESMTIQAGKIASFTKNGHNVKLLADANPSVTWIGSKPFDLGSNVPADEGVISVRNIRVRIVRAGSQIFAEIVP
ncbi:MAG TPA: tetratricopeptide repeat protein [Rectinemataceae bacterium]|nr:tetratricopeptide repeat protein [Rectinemataceae bacterium]